MAPHEILQLRTETLGVSRSVLARFLGVVEVSLVRWEAPDGSAPRGLPLLVLQALAKVAATRPDVDLGRLVRESASHHSEALKQLLELAHEQPRSAPARRPERKR